MLRCRGCDEIKRWRIVGAFGGLADSVLAVRYGACKLLVAGFEAQQCCPADGYDQLLGLTHEAADDAAFFVEMVALS